MALSPAEEAGSIHAIAVADPRNCRRGGDPVRPLGRLAADVDLGRHDDDVVVAAGNASGLKLERRCRDLRSGALTAPDACVGQERSGVCDL